MSQCCVKKSQLMCLKTLGLLYLTQGFTPYTLTMETAQNILVYILL